MKIDRLLGITIYLLNHKKVTSQALAAHFEVSARTILRDIDTLCMAGIPVVSTYGVDGGYEILDTFKIERKITGNIDYSYIVTALQGFASAYSNKELNGVLSKMQALSDDDSTNVILDFSVLNENKSINLKLSQLEQAIKDKYMVSFAYTNADNIKKHYVVEPVASMYKWYNWYLLCYYPKYCDYRTFKLNRMEDLLITGIKNSIDHNVKAAKEMWENQVDHRKYITVKLYCHNEIKAKCLEYLNGSIEKEFENGDILFTFSVPENEQFWFGALLSFGNKIEILEPDELRVRIFKTCQDILELYKKI